MPSQAQLTILFADVVGSTQLYERLGDERARTVVRACLTAVTEVTHRHGGRLVEMVGDEVYNTFASVDAAMAAAVEMHEATTAGLTVDGQRLAIHVGLHAGPVVVGDNGELYGDVINVAHRLCSQAKAGQILTAGPTVAAASVQWQSSCRLIDVATLGRREPVEVYEVVWKAEEATVLRRAVQPSRTRRGTDRLILFAGPVQTELTGERPVLTIGRGEQNDVVVALSIVSRLHARAEYRNGRFILTDQSANGTYVVPDGGPPIFVHNQDHVLAGSGTLGLGESPTPGSATALRYQAFVQANVVEQDA